jgi:hypothetical protein
MSVVIGSQTFADAGTAFHRVAGQYWLEQVPAGSEEREYEEITAPGSDGAEMKDHGFRARRIGPFRVVVISTTQDAVLAAWATMRAALEGQRAGVTVVYGGLTYVNCYLDPGSPAPEGPPQYLGDAAKWAIFGSVSLMQRRTS